MADFRNVFTLTVDPHQIQQGDIIMGTNVHIFFIKFNGETCRWEYAGQTGHVVHTARIGDRISISRPRDDRYLDWCAAVGIPRPWQR